MPKYSTIEEKSAEWNISARHIQYLCRAGRVEGAVKRAGAWFIPESAPTPAKNTKSGDKSFNYVGTKGRIFDSAIKLFMLNGFDNVSFKDIADSVGVRQTTLYGHFRTKQDILASIYDFYMHNFTLERISLKEMAHVIQKESPIDIVRYIGYEFKDDRSQRMSDITKIIFQRIGVDERAKEIARSLVVEEGIKYAENILNGAVETGRLAPFDTHVMAVFISIVRVFTLYCWILDPDSLPDSSISLPHDQQTLYKCASKLLVDLRPPDIRVQDALIES